MEKLRLDKLLNSPWFVRILALFLALMLYTAVNMETTQPSKSSSIIPGANVEQDTLSNVPLNTYYERDQYAALNVPAGVTVHMKGPGSTITTTKRQNNYEVFLDLNGLEPGTHEVSVGYRGFSNKLDIRVEPSTVEVEIQEKISTAFPVTIQYLNNNELKDGYTLGEASITPPEVTVTGARGFVESISILKTFVDVQGASEDIDQNFPVKAYDQNGNLLDLQLEPSVVNVNVPVIAPNKTVPLIINREGQLQEGLSIQSFEVSEEEVTVFGEKEELEAIEVINNINFDITEITEDVVREIKVPVPNGAKSVQPEFIEIRIDVEPEESKVINDIPISVIGLSNDLTISFISPEQQQASLEVYGTESVLSEVALEDFHLVLNLNGYTQGEHEVGIEVFGPNNVRWELNQEKATVNITNE